MFRRRTAMGFAMVVLTLSLAVPAGAAAKAATLPRAPSAAQKRALEGAVRHTHGLAGSLVVYLGISPVDRRWAIADLIPAPGQASTAARRTRRSITHQTYHRGSRGKWDPATAPLGPVSRSLYRRPTFEIDYTAHGTDQRSSVVQAGCTMTTTNDAIYAWKGVWKHLTEDELYLGARLGYDKGSTFGGSQTATLLYPCANPAAGEGPPRAECTAREKLVPAGVSALIGNILSASVVNDGSVFDETISLQPPQDNLTTPSSCQIQPDTLIWRMMSRTEVTLPADALFFTTAKTWKVAIDNPAVPGHNRVTTVAGGTETVDWSGTVTLKRDGSYLISGR